MVRPGDLLGLPDLSAHVAVFRWGLVALAMGTAWAVARGRRRIALAAALAFAVAAVAFWVLALGRPYGVFVDGAATVRAADLAVAAEAGKADESFVSGEPRTPGLGGRVAARAPRALLFLGPAWLPVLLLPLSAIALARMAGDDGWLAALLWIAFSTGDLDSVRGVGFVTGAWSRPGAALLFLMSLAALGLARRRVVTWKAALVAALVVAAVWTALGVREPGLGQVGTLLMLTFDQGLWVPLAVWGLRRVPAPAAIALLGAGGALALLGQHPWGAQAFYRSGLILAAIPAARELARALGMALQAARSTWAGLDATALGGGVLLALGMASATVAWWDPPRWDPVADASRETISAALVEPLVWLRTQTPREAVVLASPTYAPMVSILAGRRVLRAPTLLKPRDDDRRRRLEHTTLVGPRPPAPELLARYGLRFVLAAPGDFQDHGVRAPHELAEQPHLRLRHVSGEGFRVYEILQ